MLLLLMISFSGEARAIILKTKTKQLSVLLDEFVRKDNLLISFDYAAMAKIKIPAKERGYTVNELLEYLQKECYVRVDSIGSNIVLSSVKRRNYHFQGNVFDAETLEPLAGAEVSYGEKAVYTGENGQFSFLSRDMADKKIQVRYLGYTILDTTIVAKSMVNIPLQATANVLGDVVVATKASSYNVNIANRAGALKVTPKFIRKLPGYGESSIYSFLKLMPGVLATGESATDMSLRGSTEGQNTYIFDGYKVYNPWYRLNEIGTINPLLVKDVEVYKSGANAAEGEHIGGLVLLKGFEAIPKQPKVTIFANNFLVNGLLKVPLSEKLALFLAARKNIAKELEIPDAVGEYTIRNTFDGFADNYFVNISPRYQLYDANLKLVWKLGANSKLSFSGFGSDEQNRLNATTLTNQFRLQNRQLRQNKQYAGAIHYATYKDGLQFDVVSSYSKLKSGLSGMAEVWKLNTNIPKISEIENSQKSGLEEFQLRAKCKFPLTSDLSFDIGAGQTLSHLEEFDQKEEQANTNQESWHSLSYLFANSQLQLGCQWNAEVGTRLNYSGKTNRLYFEPRFALNYYPSESWKFYTSYGIFQQFVYNTNVFDKLKNNNYKRVSVQDNIPVSELSSFCLGTRYVKEPWTVSVELFYKYLGERFYFDTSTNNQKKQKKIQAEKMRYVGSDFFMKYQKKNLVAWLSFTLSDFGVFSRKPKNIAPNEKVSSLFAEDVAADYEHSAFDMRRELKVALAYTFQKVTFSASYVYGSGFKMWHQASSVGKPDYSRLDLGAFYSFRLFHQQTELGFSLLNALNRKNKKLDEFSRFGVGSDIVSYNTYGVKRTPAFFIKINF